MTSLTKRSIKGTNCNTLEPNPDGSINIVDISEKSAVFRTYAVKHFQNGGSNDMNVQGDVTQVLFDYTPSAGELINVEQINLLMIDPGSMDADDFGSIVKLTNGLKLEAQINGASVTEILNMFDNLDVGTMFTSEPSISGEENKGFLDEKDQFRGFFKFEIPLKLDGDKGDFIRWVVRDDLRKLKFLRSNAKIFRTL